jgi:hypothetical protein
MDKNGLREGKDMTIIKIAPEWNGSHNSIENVDNILPGWAEIPESCMDVWKASGPFVNVTTDNDGKITALTAGAELGVPTDAELLTAARAAATERISGKCSAAIYSGVTVGEKHYRMTENDQLSLNAAIGLATSTGEAISYAADGEASTKMTSAQLSEIGKAGYDWGFVCRSYYGLLYTWVQRETDTDKLAAIHFGSALPDSYMQQLTALLNSAGLDITKYSAALSA